MNENDTLGTMTAEFKKEGKGMPLQDFEKFAAKFGFTSVRPKQINGKGQMTTADYRPNRINVAITAPVISTEIVKVGKREYVEEKVDHLKSTVTDILSIG